MEPKSPDENWQIVVDRWNGVRAQPGSDFDKAPTDAILGFELFVLIGFAAAAILLPKIIKRTALRFLVLACAVLVFELFTAPMWRNLKMGYWAYLYQQVSWILTIGWTTLILATLTFIDHLYPDKRETWRFLVSIAVLTPIVFCFEIVLGAIGLRGYAPEVLNSVSGYQVAGVPVEALYYVPVFLTLIISFYKYWMTILERKPIAPLARVPLLRTFTAAVVGVLLFELMVEPMVINSGFPDWSYVYRDVTLVMTGLWIVLLWVSVTIVEMWLPHWERGHRFLAYLGLMMLFAVPIEGWFIQTGHRVYGPSASANFSGLTLPWSIIPLEVVFAIPLYFALVIAFVGYAEIARTEVGDS